QSACIADYMLIFFFFQAEDGIRYWSVTGVQTCALPISKSRVFSMRLCPSPRWSIVIATGCTLLVTALGSDPVQKEQRSAESKERSEERRVGKEWRCRGWGEE